MAWMRYVVLAVAVLWAGCGDDDVTIGDTDAGSDSSMADAGANDSGSEDSGAEDGGAEDSGAEDSGAEDSGAEDSSTEDSGTDAGPLDAGADAGSDAGVPLQSRIHAVLPTGVITLPMLDASNNPIVVAAAAAFDHDAMMGEDIFASIGSDLFRMTAVSATQATFGDIRALVDASANPLTPNVLFSGQLGAGDALVGIFGSSGRVYEFSVPQFGAEVALLDGPASPFSPISATFVDLGTGTTAVVALQADDPQLFVLNTASGMFEPIVAPEQCSDSTAIEPTLVLGASLPGLAPPGIADALAIVEGSNIFVLEEISPSVCFSDAYPLVDGDSNPITPHIAFGWDFNGDGTDNVIIVDTIAL